MERIRERSRPLYCRPEGLVNAQVEMQRSTEHWEGKVSGIGQQQQGLWIPQKICSTLLPLQGQRPTMYAKERAMGEEIETNSKHIFLGISLTQDFPTA